MGFKMKGSPMHYGTAAHKSALKIKSVEARKAEIASAGQESASGQATTSPAKETDWAALQKKSIEKDPRYSKLSPEEYKIEAKRQMAHYNKTKKETGTGKWDAMGVYDKDGNKIKKDETVKLDVKEPKLTTDNADLGPVKVEKAPAYVPTQKEAVTTEKKELKDARKSGRDAVKEAKKQKRINILKEKKDVAHAKGKTKRTERLERKIERKETGKTRREQRQERREDRKEARQDRRDARKTARQNRRIAKKANKAAREQSVVDATKAAVNTATQKVKEQDSNSPVTYKKSPAKIAPLVAMAGKAIAGKVASKAVDKVTE